MTDTPTQSRPWYREPMVWMTFGLPAIVVVASFVTLSIVLRSSGNVDSVQDPVQRVGKGQTIDLAPDQEAARRGLNARLVLSPDTEAMEVLLLNDETDSPSLKLAFYHPTQARDDQTLSIVRTTPGTYLGRLPVARDHAWNVYLSEPDGSWRIQGRLEANTATTLLEPAVDAPAARADGG